ncbi:MAG: AAA family ATPase [Clostridia bacterium]|nr:AAA family ATPase [Clostridia bacterium]
MKLLIIAGDCAVGKMTVGQEIARRTGLRLFHNHMTIEPVIEIFGTYNSRVVSRLREVIFEEFAASDAEGMIFTYMWAFDVPADTEYIVHVADIFRCHGAEIYCAELDAPQEIRLVRNRTENRLKHKASKRDLELSDARLRDANEKYRLISRDGEVPFAHFIRIENAELSVEETAQRIIDAFGL